MVRHFPDLFDLTPDSARALIDQALELKRQGEAGRRADYLRGRILGMIFEKPSLRTRVSFEAAITQLGGNALFLRSEDVGIGVRESVSDFARVISQYVDALAIRTYKQSTIDELAVHATIPIINALSDSAHPCQAMADYLTLRESLGTTEGLKLVFVGDGNNVARSLAVASALLGSDFILACPRGYDFPSSFRERFAAAFPGYPLRVEHDPRAAVRNADAVYTDVWASMGQEKEVEERRLVFEPYRVDEQLLELAASRSIFLHCLPAKRGEEVTDGVLDGQRSLVIQQAANRLHFQKALLLWLIQSESVEGATQALLPRLSGQI